MITFDVKPSGALIPAMPLPTLDDMHVLEGEISKLPPREAPVTHYFANGVYCRVMHIAAGTVATGKIHKTSHIFIVASGDITILTEHGMERVQGPFICSSDSGMKRAVYAHSDTVLITADGTFETDLKRIEDELIEYEPHIEALRALQSERFPELECAS